MEIKLVDFCFDTKLDYDEEKKHTIHRSRYNIAPEIIDVKFSHSYVVVIMIFGSDF